MHDHVDGFRVAGEGLIDRVVDDFLNQMVGSRCIGVHARPALDRVKARENLDICCVVTTAH